MNHEEIATKIADRFFIDDERMPVTRKNLIDAIAAALRRAANEAANEAAWKAYDMLWAGVGPDEWYKKFGPRQASGEVAAPKESFMDQKPSVGGIVHFYPACDSQKGQPYPAIITHVNENGSVNLYVFDDGKHRLAGGCCVTDIKEAVIGSYPFGHWVWPPEGCKR